MIKQKMATGTQQELEPSAETLIAMAEKKVTSYRKWIEYHLDRFNDYYNRITSLKRRSG
jgi:hypothetical protein